MFDYLQHYCLQAIDYLPAIRRENPDCLRTFLYESRLSRLTGRKENVGGGQPALKNCSRQLFIVAADHPARGALAASGKPLAMANRRDLLLRLVEALTHPRVDGLLATADVAEELAYLAYYVQKKQPISSGSSSSVTPIPNFLQDKLLVASMNRGGLAGASFEMDDRYTAYDLAGAQAAGADALKVLLRIDLADPGTLRTMETTARIIGQAASARLPIMVEPFISYRDSDGRVVNDLSTEAVIRSVAISSGLGNTSAYTWLKLPVVEEMERITQATTLPILLLGGDDSSLWRLYEKWSDALRLPGICGLVVGRSLLYPKDGLSVTEAIEGAAKLLIP